MTPRHYNVMIISIGSTAFQTVYIRTRDIYHLQLFDKSADVGSLDQYRKVRLQKQKVSYAFLCFILQCTVYTLKSMLLKYHHKTDMSVHIWVLYMVCRPRDQGVPTWTDCLGGASAPRQKGIVHFRPRGKSKHCPGTHSQWRIYVECYPHNSCTHTLAIPTRQSMHRGLLNIVDGCILYVGAAKHYGLCGAIHSGVKHSGGVRDSQ